MRYQDRVYGLALRLTRSAEDAEDVAQEAFLKAYRALPSFDGRSAFYTWLFRITFNTAQSKLRSLGRRHRHESAMSAGHGAGRGEDDPPDADPADPSPGPDEQIERKDSAASVLAALDSLDADSRVAVVLRDVEGLSYDEIAQVTGSTRAAVKSRLHRARAELARSLRGVLGNG
jgi:RNA polymerase sigma-70 factor (ECF subfamily)